MELSEPNIHKYSGAKTQRNNNTKKSHEISHIDYCWLHMCGWCWWRWRQTRCEGTFYYCCVHEYLSPYSCWQYDCESRKKAKQIHKMGTIAAASAATKTPRKWCKPRLTSLIDFSIWRYFGEFSLSSFSVHMDWCTYAKCYTILISTI